MISNPFFLLFCRFLLFFSFCETSFTTPNWLLSIACRLLTPSFRYRWSLTHFFSSFDSCRSYRSAALFFPRRFGFVQCLSSPDTLLCDRWSLTHLFTFSFDSCCSYRSAELYLPRRFGHSALSFFSPFFLWFLLFLGFCVVVLLADLDIVHCSLLSS